MHSHEHHTIDNHSGLNAMAVNATLHCLTGCAIGEAIGLILGAALGWGSGLTILVSIALAFIFGFSLSTLPLLKTGLSFFAALSVVVAADTVSIATMEITDNAVMVLIPGAMNAGLVNPLLWVAMPFSLVVAYFAAYPVNRYLLTKGKGHALVMNHYSGRSH